MDSPSSPKITSSLGSLSGPSDLPIYDAYISARQSCVLVVAVHIKMFEFLKTAKTTQEIASHFKFSIRGATAMLINLRIITAINSTDDEKWIISESGSKFLLPGSPQYIGNLFELEWDGFITPKSLLTSLQKDAPQIYDGKDPWDAHTIDPEQAKQFTEAMHSISSRPSLALAEKFDFNNYSHILDVGGGSGVYLIGILEKFPHMFGTVFEIPAVTPIAQKKLDALGFQKRAGTVSGNFFKDPYSAFGAGKSDFVPKSKTFDCILLSQILHDWNWETGEKLVKRCFDALPSSGALILNEKLMSDDKTQPLANLLVNIDMLIWTEGQQYTSKELIELLTRVGFKDCKCIPTTGYWSIVYGIKP